ncbi:alpha/beta hydrolase [Photobacterium sp. SDRW27]|uniref:alpha/beta fold hydrolase n=1 Tax=Photobacterium obscurum TaxID=2829490 RepID=UPI002242EB46|nr:alpha/beta hydrolase [Photobacterium obscurum]MCW8328838.1 alpha/beta hydrolase [Photobacterium obscurum]
MRFLHLLLLVIITSASFSAHSDSWLDKVKSGYKEVEKKLSFNDKKGDHPDNKVDIAQAKPLPTDMPQHWKFSYFTEPEFDSQVVVLETGFKHKQSILLVHGLGELGMKDWLDVIPFLEQNYHVIAIDLPGFGLSAVPNGRYSPTHYAKVLAAVTQQYAKDPLIVMGHSMGGAVSLRFASMYPESVHKLILVDAAGILTKTAFVKHLSTIPVEESSIPEMFKKKWAQLNDFSSSLVELGTLNDSASDFLQENDFAWDILISSAPNMNAALSLVEEDFNQAVRALKMPVDIIWGQNDSVAPIRTAKVLENMLQNSRLQVINGAGHVPMKSHNKQFLAALNKSLSNTIVSESKIPQISQRQGTLSCIDEANNTYSGYYDAVLLERCTNTKLVNVTTRQMTIKDSLVEAENLSITSNGVALSAEESVIRVTNGYIEGKNAVNLSGSRIDMAGVSIQASDNGVFSDVHSQVIFSISDMNSRYYQGLIHGEFEVEKQSLDSLYSKSVAH